MKQNEQEPGRWHRHTVRVRYQETDRMGVVYHANYINWFEVGRTELIRDRGFPYSRIEEMGLYLPVVELESKFHLPARYDDWIAIYTRIAAFTALTIKFESQIRRVAEQDTASAWAQGMSSAFAHQRTSSPFTEHGTASALADDAAELAVRSVARSAGNSAVRFANEAAERPAADRIEPEGELLVTGTTRHVWLNRDWKPARVEREAPELYRLLGDER